MATFRTLNPAAAAVMERALGSVAPDRMRDAAESPFDDVSARGGLF